MLDPSRIHIPVTQATVDCGVYLDGGRLPGRYTHAAAHAKVSELASENGAAFVWIGLHEPDEHQMRSVADVFGLHPLLVRGAIQTYYRPRLERYDDTLVLVLKTVDYADHDGLRDVRHFVKAGEVMIAVGPGFVITVRHGKHRGLAEVREQMHQSPTILKLGPYAVMYAIAGHVVDGYQRVSGLLKNRHTSSRPLSRPMSNRSTCSNVRLPRCATRSARRPRPWGASTPTTAISSRSRSAGTCGRFSNVTCRQRSASSATT